MISILDIQKIVYNLIKKYGTDDPFELADSMNISIFYEELGTINGYYNKPLRMKQIHINANLDDNMQKFTCAHELGHAILHPNASTPFLRSKTLFSINKMENEANTFAAELLIPDELILENPGVPISQIARIAGYCEEIMKFKKL